MRAKVFIPLLVIIVIAAAGAVGYWFAKNNQPEAKTQTVTKSSPKAKVSRKAAYEGQVITSANKKFSLTIPNGWQTVVNCTNNDVLFVNDNDQAMLDYKKDSPPLTKEQTCGDDAPKLFFVAANPTNQAEPAKADAKSFQTTAGLEGVKTCENNVSSGSLDRASYLQQCTYRFEKNGTVYSLTYNRPDSTYLDRTELIDKVAKSFMVQ